MQLAQIVQSQQNTQPIHFYTYPFMNNRQWRPGLPYSSPSLPRHNSRIGSAALISTIFDAGLPYSKRLSVHRSCVNALSFSRNGRLLASAGDGQEFLRLNDVKVTDGDQGRLSRQEVVHMELPSGELERTR